MRDVGTGEASVSQAATRSLTEAMAGTGLVAVVVVDRVADAAPLAEILTSSLSGGAVATWAWVSLAIWAVAAPVAAASLFRWE